MSKYYIKQREDGSAYISSYGIGFDIRFNKKGDAIKKLNEIYRGKFVSYCFDSVTDIRYGFVKRVINNRHYKNGFTINVTTLDGTKLKVGAVAICNKLTNKSLEYIYDKYLKHD